MHTTSCGQAAASNRFTLRAVLAMGLVGCALLLSACGKPEGEGVSAVRADGAIPARQAPSLAAVQRHATGIEVGNKRSARHFFVFFDPMCEACAAWWAASEQLRAEARLTWVPVASTPEAATSAAALLVAENPAEALALRMTPGAGALTAGDDLPDPNAAASVAQNTRLLASFGAAELPYVVGRNLATGQPYASSQIRSAAELMTALGWAVSVETAQPAPGRALR